VNRFTVTLWVLGENYRYFINVLDQNSKLELQLFCNGGGGASLD
jgi:hypothetical protein